MNAIQSQKISQGLTMHRRPFVDCAVVVAHKVPQLSWDAWPAWWTAAVL